MTEGRQPRVIMADKRIRMLLMGTCVAAVIVAIVLIQWVLPWGQEFLEGQEPATALRIIQVVIALIFLSVVPLGAYLVRFGRQVVEHRQMPPPGTRVIVDAKVIEGAKAVARGRALMAIAFLLIILGLLGGLWLPWRLGQVFGERLREAPPESTRPVDDPGKS